MSHSTIGGGDDDDDELTQENSTHEEVCFTVCYNKSSDWASILVLVSSVCAYTDRRFLQ